MITIRNLSHTYPGTRRQAARTAIHDLTLTVPDGSFCILSGPNGSGKSTLFRILCGMATPSAGHVAVGGHDLATDGAAVRGLMGVVFQSPAVDKHLSVAENLRLHGALYGLRGAALAERQAEALAWTDLKDRLGDKVDTLSGGLARQVELAKCLLTRPKVLLLDEPTTGLDPGSRRAFLGALRRLHRERGMTILMTSHVFAEADGADAVAIMAAGRLLAHGSPAELTAMVGREMVVILPRDADILAPRLETDLGLTVLRHGRELRIEDMPADGPVALIDRILRQWRPEVLSIAVKTPDLEDVFVHVTGRGGADASPLPSPSSKDEAA